MSHLGLAIAALLVLGVLAQRFLGINLTGMLAASLSNDTGWILSVVAADALGRWSARPAVTHGHERGLRPVAAALLAGMLLLSAVIVTAAPD